MPVGDVRVEYSVEMGRRWHECSNHRDVFEFVTPAVETGTDRKVKMFLDKYVRNSQSVEKTVAKVREAFANLQQFALQYDERETWEEQLVKNSGTYRDFLKRMHAWQRAVMGLGLHLTAALDPSPFMPLVNSCGDESEHSVFSFEASRPRGSYQTHYARLMYLLTQSSAFFVQPYKAPVKKQAKSQKTDDRTTIFWNNAGNAIWTTNEDFRYAHADVTVRDAFKVAFISTFHVWYNNVNEAALDPQRTDVAQTREKIRQVWTDMGKKVSHGTPKACELVRDVNVHLFSLVKQRYAGSRWTEPPSEEEQHYESQFTRLKHKSRPPTGRVCFGLIPIRCAKRENHGREFELQALMRHVHQLFLFGLDILEQGFVEKKKEKLRNGALAKMEGHVARLAAEMLEGEVLEEHTTRNAGFYRDTSSRYLNERNPSNKRKRE